MSRVASPLVSVLVALLLAACGGSSADGGDDGGGGSDDGYRPDVVARLTFQEQDGGTSGYAIGFFGDGPELPPQHEVARAGDCVAYEHPDPGLCEGTCDGFCDDGTCLPAVRWLDAGTVTVDGGPSPMALEPSESNFYTSGESRGDLFADGDDLTVTVEGAATFPAVTLHARGVAALDTTPLPVLELHGDLPATFTWTAGPAGGRVQVALRLGWHGTPWQTMILCETDDDGSLEIPGAVVAAMPEFGGEGLFQWPSELQRYSRDVAETSAGPVELFVSSRQVLWWTKD